MYLPLIRKTQKFPVVTVSEVQEKLPDVEVMHFGNFYRCKVTGRFNKFATVTPIEPPDWLVGTTWEFSWQAIARALAEKGWLTT
jgi:hypothetical protein